MATATTFGGCAPPSSAPSWQPCATPACAWPSSSTSTPTTPTSTVTGDDLTTGIDQAFQPATTPHDLIAGSNDDVAVCDPTELDDEDDGAHETRQPRACPGRRRRRPAQALTTPRTAPAGPVRREARPTPTGPVLATRGSPSVRRSPKRPTAKATPAASRDRRRTRETAPRPKPRGRRVSPWAGVTASRQTTSSLRERWRRQCHRC